MYILISFTARCLLLRVILLSDITVQITNGQRNSPNYIGCLEGNNDNRIGFRFPYSRWIKYDPCLSHCHGTTYFGLQRYGCFCIDTYDGLGVLNETACNTTCITDNSEWCGGLDAMDVYSVSLPNNLAIRRPTWQSSTYVAKYLVYPYKPLSSELAVDGNKESNIAGGSCMHTDYEDNPWWAVDLGYRTRIRAVALTNRGDCCGDRTSNFIVGLSNTSPNESTPTPGQYTECGRGPTTSATGGGTYYVRCVHNQLPSRYVIIQLPRRTNLNFCELEVYGGDTDECTEAAGNGNCSQICLNLLGSYMCDCRGGFHLAHDKRTCIDIDECTVAAGNGNCSHVCVNTIGSYDCFCTEGFILAEDNKNCVDVDECQIDNGGCSEFCKNSVGSFNCLYSSQLQTSSSKGLRAVVITMSVLLAAAAVTIIILLVKLKRRSTASPSDDAAVETHEYQTLQATAMQLEVQQSSDHTANGQHAVGIESPIDAVYELVK